MPTPIKAFYDVIIVGAGPCGVTCANLLGNYGISTLLIDREGDVLDIPRAIGICEEGSRILQNAGVLDGTTEDAREIDRVEFSLDNKKNLFFADLSPVRNGYKTLRTFYQPRLETRMREGLKRHSTLDFHVSTELKSFTEKGDRIELTLQQGDQDIQTECRFLFACDGARSEIRKRLNIGFTGSTYPQDWMILDIDQNPYPADHVTFTINPERPSVTLPAPGNKRRWEFVIKEGENPDDLFAPEKLAELVAPWGRLEDMKIERKAVYTFHARTAENYRKNNIFLVGDAAHITPPFAGQGMMAGLRDAYNLSWKVAEVVKGRLKETILDTYEPERIPQSRQIVNFAQRMGNVILPQNPLIAGLRNLFFNTLKVLGVHNENKPLLLEKIPNHINGSMLNLFWKTRGARTGVELPQFELPKNGAMVLSDDLIGDRFLLVGWNANAAEHLSPQTRDRWERLEGDTVTFSDTDRQASGPMTLHDPDRKFSEALSEGKRVIMIRPDKMIIINCKPADLDKNLSTWMDKYAA